jgi:hypothetical protein
VDSEEPGGPDGLPGKRMAAGDSQIVPKKFVEKEKARTRGPGAGDARLGEVPLAGLHLWNSSRSSTFFSLYAGTFGGVM